MISAERAIDERPHRARPAAAHGAAACPVCGSAALTGTGVALSYGRLHGCAGCGSGILLPRPSQAELSAQHAADDYFDHPYFEERRRLTGDLEHRYAERAGELARLLGPLGGRRVLEVGCDTGLFVGYLRDRHGVEAAGVDVAHKAVGEARKAGLDVRLGTLEQLALPAGSFDAVCAYDLIEHVADPAGFLAEVRRILAPGGAVVIETPNYEGLIYRLGRGLAAVPLGLALTGPGQRRLWPPFHVQYFNTGSLAGLLARSGFTDTHVAGRELAAAELAVGWPAKPVVLAIFALAHAVGANTLLHAHAR